MRFYGDDMLQELKNRLSERRSRRNNRTFLEATMAACALVAMADKKVTFSESSKIDQILESLDQLRDYDVHDVINLFNQHIDAMEADLDGGRAEAMKAVEVLVGDPKAGRVIVNICLAIAGADGAFTPDERWQIENICQKLDVDLSEFSL
jgi:tellurite resistance protein